MSYIIIFVLGFLAGAVGIMILLALSLDNRSKRPPTKEEWKDIY